MKFTERFIFASAFLFSAVLNMHAQTTVNHTYTVLVGTYTDKTGSKGIYAFDFDPSTGKLTPVGLAAETPNPSWIVVHPNGKWVYAANESGKQSTISAFSLDAKTRKLTLLNQRPSEGEDPCYLSFDTTGRYLFVANYTSGTVAVFPILDDGKFGAPTSVVKDAGTLGPNKDRQEGPHAHWIAARGQIFVADLGLDRVLLYGFDPANGKLRKAPRPDARHPFFSNDLELNPGAGPRHVAFSSTDNGAHQVTYVLSELDSTVALFGTTIEGSYSGLPGQKISTLPAGFTGRNDAAEITIHPDGKWLFVSNRGHDSIAVFAIDQHNGTLTAAGHFPTGGQEPRHFALDPTGQFLLPENQHSSNIVVFHIDPGTGALTEVSRTENIPSPVCLAFVPTAAP
jgi:6-phosphogluconolactonase